MTALRKFFGDVGIYTLGRVVGAIIPLVLVPFITRTFSLDDYGSLEVILVCSGVVGVLLSSGLPGAYTYFVHSDAYAGSRNVLVGVAAGWFLIWGCVLLVLVWTIFPFAFRLLAGRSLSWEELALFCCFSASQQFVAFFVTVLRMDQRVWLAVGLSVGASAVGGLLTVALIYWFEPSIANYLFGFAISFAAAAILGGLIVRTDLIQATTHLSDLRRLLVFGLPLAASSLFVLGLTLVDRVIVAKFLGTQELAVYALAGKIASLTQHGIQSVTLALQPVCMRIIHKRDKDATERMIGAMWRYIALVFFSGCLIGVWLTPWLVTVVAPAEYADASVVVPYLMLAHVCYSFILFTNIGSLKAEKTHLFTISVICGVLINIGLSLVLTPIYGLTGAACGTLAGTIAASAVNFGFSRWAWRIELPAKRIAAMTLVTFTAVSLLNQGATTSATEIQKFVIVTVAIVILATLSARRDDLTMLALR